MRTWVLGVLLILLLQAYPPGEGVFPVGGSGSVAPPAPDLVAPVLGLLDPSGAGGLGGLSYTVRAQATDDVGISDVCFYYEYCGAGACAGPFEAATLIGCDTTEAAGWYTQLWTFPSCFATPSGHFSIWFRARDAAGNQDTAEQDDQVLTGRGC